MLIKESIRARRTREKENGMSEVKIKKNIVKEFKLLFKFLISVLYIKCLIRVCIWRYRLCECCWAQRIGCVTNKGTVQITTATAKQKQIAQRKRRKEKRKKKEKIIINNTHYITFSRNYCVIVVCFVCSWTKLFERSHNSGSY